MNITQMLKYIGINFIGRLTPEYEQQIRNILNEIFSLELKQIYKNCNENNPTNVVKRLHLIRLSKTSNTLPIKDLQDFIYECQLNNNIETIKRLNSINDNSTEFSKIVFKDPNNSPFKMLMSIFSTTDPLDLAIQVLTYCIKFNIKLEYKQNNSLIQQLLNPFFKDHLKDTLNLEYVASNSNNLTDIIDLLKKLDLVKSTNINVCYDDFKMLNFNLLQYHMQNNANILVKGMVRTLHELLGPEFVEINFTEFNISDYYTFYTQLKYVTLKEWVELFKLDYSKNNCLPTPNKLAQLSIPNITSKIKFLVYKDRVSENTGKFMHNNVAYLLGLDKYMPADDMIVPSEKVYLAELIRLSKPEEVELIVKSFVYYASHSDNEFDFTEEMKLINNLLIEKRNNPDFPISTLLNKINYMLNAGVPFNTIVSKVVTVEEKYYSEFVQRNLDTLFLLNALALSLPY